EDAVGLARGGEPACVELYHLAPDVREVVLDAEVLEGGTVRQHHFQQLEESGGIPLPVAQLEEGAALSLLGAHPDRLVEAVVGGRHAQLAVEGEEGRADRLDDAAGVVERLREGLRGADVPGPTLGGLIHNLPLSRNPANPFRVLYTGPSGARQRGHE